MLISPVVKRFSNDACLWPRLLNSWNCVTAPEGGRKGGERLHVACARNTQTDASEITWPRVTWHLSVDPVVYARPDMTSSRLTDEAPSKCRLWPITTEAWQRHDWLSIVQQLTGHQSIILESCLTPLSTVES